MVEQKKYYLSAADLLTLLYNVERGSKTKAVGFHDCKNTLPDVTKAINRAYSRTPISQEFLESALWSCNVMGEEGKFWEPRGASFETWVKQFCTAQGLEFDSFFNTVEERAGVANAGKIRRY